MATKGDVDQSSLCDEGMGTHTLGPPVIAMMGPLRTDEITPLLSSLHESRSQLTAGRVWRTLCPSDVDDVR